jgi:hypothetical protein
MDPLGKIVIQLALGTGLQVHVEAVLTVKEPNPPDALNA